MELERESTLDTFVAPLTQTYKLMPCMGMGGSAGHDLPLAVQGPLLVHTSPSLCFILTLPEDAAQWRDVIIIIIINHNYL